MLNSFLSDPKNLELFGEAILLASMQFSIGSVEMSSKFSVKNFSKDQETLQNAADALVDYMRIGIMWAVGLSFLFYSRFQVLGAVVSLVCNIAIMAWIYYSYLRAFNMACAKYKLKMPIIQIIKF